LVDWGKVVDGRSSKGLATVAGTKPANPATSYFDPLLPTTLTINLVFDSTVFSILIFFGQTVVVYQSYTGG